LHRREAWETPGLVATTVLDDILLGIRRAAEKRPDVDFVYPVHLNPNVQRAAARALGATANAKLVAPLPYLRFVEAMAGASAIVSDSGGVQEEAPSLGIPVLVLRKTTERPEAVEAGANVLVGTHPDDIERALLAVLDKPRDGRGHAIPRPNPFGDGHAAQRIVQSVLHFWGRGDAPGEFLVQDSGSQAIEATA
jgi:UDP-N-acetylglucosamine 2-epimerase (non-hydrolysing)